MWLLSSVLLTLVGICSADSYYNITEKQVRLRAYSFGCNEVNPNYIANHSCYLKPTRDGCGLYFARFWVSEPVNDMWISVSFLYKAGHVYRPWIFKWNIDICEIMEDRFHADPFITTIKMALAKVGPDLLHKCPYVGNVGVEKFNFAGMFESTIPKIFPTGTYKTIVRLYREETNETYLNIFGVSEIKAVDVMKRYAMG